MHTGPKSWDLVIIMQINAALARRNRKAWWLIWLGERTSTVFRRSSSNTWKTTLWRCIFPREHRYYWALKSIAVETLQWNSYHCTKQLSLLRSRWMTEPGEGLRGLLFFFFWFFLLDYFCHSFSYSAVGWDPGFYIKLFKALIRGHILSCKRCFTVGILFRRLHICFVLWRWRITLLRG